MHNHDNQSLISVTILVNDIAPINMIGEHGFSIWIDNGRHGILFDTGQSSLFMSNAHVLGIDLKNLDTVVISHGHYDHTGGLSGLSHYASQTALYIHPEALHSKYVRHYREESRYIGISMDLALKIKDQSLFKQVVWTEKPTDIYPGFTVTGPIPRQTEYENVCDPFFLDAESIKSDFMPDDQALYFESNDGLVVIVGCAHAGIINTLHYVSQLAHKKQIHTVIGGLHLNSASEERIIHTLAALYDLHVKQICPVHCTGHYAIEKIRQAFGDNYISGAVGTKLFFRKA
ncbi:MAG: MBL fold metallo-hydrolase [Sedimentisphaerales bacterium]|nr:MBL fold metallo-hydrolase [Sedimentisphaerales bacterium]